LSEAHFAPTLKTFSGLDRQMAALTVAMRP
jgi:hypothetical protein